MSVPNNSLLSERLAILAAINPIAYSTSATAAISSYISLAATNGNYFQRFLPVVQLGDNGTGTVTINLLKASDTSGTGATVISSVALAATNGDNVIRAFDVNGVAYDTTKPFIAIQATSTDSSGVVSGLILAGDGRYETAATYNKSGVTVTNAL